MTAEQLTKLDKLADRWTNNPASPVNDRAIAADVMDLLPDVLKHIKRITDDLENCHQQDSLKTKEINILVSENRNLAAERDSLRWDIEAYRGALGYSIPGNHTGKLTDGTVPQCGLCNSEYRKNLESERDAALKACKFYRDTLSCIVGFDEDSPWDDPGHCAKDALSRCDCGKGYVKAESLKCFKCDDGHTPLYCLNCAREGYHHDDEWRPVVEALKTIRDVACGENQCKTEAMHALAHAESLLKK